MNRLDGNGKEDQRRLAGGFTLSPLIVIGAVLILAPIFVFIILQNINRQETFGTRLFLEKGAALIRAFEAGTRAGMMGQGWGNRRLQELLTETARQPDIAYLLLVDDEGRILAHSDMNRIGSKHVPPLDQKAAALSSDPLWRFVETENGIKIFEVYKAYRPSGHMGRMPHDDMMHPRNRQMRRRMKEMHKDERFPYQERPNHFRLKRQMKMFFEQFGFTPPDRKGRVPFEPTIILGFNTQTLDAARADDRNRAIITGLILFLVSAFGIVLLFLFYNYRTARSSLSRIKAFSDSLLDNMPTGLVAFNNRLEIISLNAFAEALLDLGPESHTGAHAETVLPSSLWKQVQEVMNQPDAAAREVDCRLASGRVVPLEIDLSHFTGDADDAVGYILLLKDLSQVKALEREIIRSQRLASIGRLAAGVAHEIRNPLSSIKGFATYFKERYPDVPQDQKIAGIMIEEVERLNRVVGQLLELARPVQINAAPADLKQLMDDSIRLVEQSALEKNVVVMRPEGALGEFSLDSDKIRQVLLNLYLNALDAMPDGGRLDIRLALQTDENRLEISVGDTGVGIQPEDLTKIYDPYYTTKQTGTGLGLAVVHNIVEAHNGTLTVDSRLGKGSTFTLSIPEANGESDDES